MIELKVFQVAPAPARTAQFLQRVLHPVIEAVGFDVAPPLEFRPTGDYGG